MYANAEILFRCEQSSKLIANEAKADPREVALAFLTPRRKPARTDLTNYFSSERIEIDLAGLKLPAWVSGSGPTVLLIHGWEGAHGDLAEIAASLNIAGLRTVSFDMPAHGEAPGRMAHIPMMADAILAVAHAVGPVHAAVAHSVGGAALALALTRMAITPRVALIGSPARYRAFAKATAIGAGLDAAGTEAMMAHVERFGIDLNAIDTPRFASGLGGVSALLLHSRDDKVVSIRDGHDIAKAWPGATFVELNGLGHNRILNSSQTISRLVDFVAPPFMIGQPDTPADPFSDAA